MIEHHIYRSFYNIKKKFDVSPLFIFFEVLEKLKPWIGLKIVNTSYSKKKRIQAYPIILTKNMQYNKAIS